MKPAQAILGALSMSQTPQQNSSTPIGKITPALLEDWQLVHLLSDQDASDQIRLNQEIEVELAGLNVPQLDKLLRIIRLCRSIAS